jgi:hypothetical protein
METLPSLLMIARIAAIVILATAGVFILLYAF